MAHPLSVPALSAHQVSLPVLSAGLDWVSATAKTGLKARLVETMGAAWVRSQVVNGYDETPFAWAGYTGRRVEGVSVGSRDDGTFVRLSGEMARLHGHVLLGYVSHCSRVDLQVTVLEQNSEKDWANVVAASVSPDKRIASGRIACTHVQDNQGGHTFYLGRRISDRFFRVYNKYAESKGTWPAGSWRFEVEYKGRRAEHWHERLKSQEVTANTAIGIVRSAFLDYGFTLPVATDQPPFRDRTVRPQTTDERRLEYLSTNVRPVVQRLREAFGAATLRKLLDLEYEHQPDDPCPRDSQA